MDKQNREELLISIHVDNRQFSSAPHKSLAEVIKKLVRAANDLGLKGSVVNRIDYKCRTDCVNNKSYPATDASYELWGKKVE